MICKKCQNAITLKAHWDRSIYEYYRTLPNTLWCRKHRCVVNSIADRECDNYYE